MSDQTWSSGRCLRLLRPLRAHLVALEKEQQREVEFRSAAVKKVKPKKRSINDQSPDWLGRNTKRDKKFGHAKTYNSGSRTIQTEHLENVQSALLDGEIQMPNVFMAQSAHVAAIAEQRAGEQINRPATVPRKRKQLKSFQGVRSEDNVEGLIKAYLAIMCATEAHTICQQMQTSLVNHEMAATGAPSLRAMSVRAAAIFIETESASQVSLRAEERKDVSEDVYDDFNEIMSRDQGLPILAQLLRAHATIIVCQAIRNQAVSAQAGLDIVSALGSGATLEQELILESVAHAVGPDSHSKNCLRDSMVPRINGMLKSSMRVSRQSWRHEPFISKRILRQLACNSAFPIDWLATPAYKDEWQVLVMDIASHSKQYHNSRDFLKEVFRKACGSVKMNNGQCRSLRSIAVIRYGTTIIAPDNCDSCNHSGATRDPRIVRNAFTSSISSLLTIFASLVFVGSEEYNMGQGIEIQRLNLTEVKSFLHEIGSQILEGKHDEWLDDRIHAPFLGSRCASVLFCVLLTEAVSANRVIHNQQALVDLILSLDHSLESWMEAEYGILEELPALLVNVCQAASQVSGAQASDWLNSAIETLMSLDLSKRAQAFLQQLCREAVVQMGVDMPAQLSANHAYKDNSSTFNFQRTPAKQKQNSSDNPGFTGYRWEPMLSEWVSATPVRPMISPNSIRPTASEFRMGPPQRPVISAVEVLVPHKSNITSQPARHRRKEQAGTRAVLDSSLGPGESIFTSPIHAETPTKHLSTARNYYHTRTQYAHGQSSSSSVTQVEVFVPSRQDQVQIRRISDFVLSSSPAPTPFRRPVEKKLVSPPPTPMALRPTSGNNRVPPTLQSTSAMTQKRARPAAGTDSDFLDSSEDELAPPKRRCARLSQKAASRISTNRRSGRLSLQNNRMDDVSDDDLS